MSVVIAQCSCPDAECAERIGRALVDERLAACVQVLGPIVSFYRWDGERREDREVLLLVKTAADRVEQAGERVRALHPYETPEWLVTAAVTGLPGYLAWVLEQSRDP